MARLLLWILLVMGFIVGVVTYIAGEELELFTRIYVFYALGILAICEAIETRKGR